MIKPSYTHWWEHKPKTKKSMQVILVQFMSEYALWKSEYDKIEQNAVNWIANLHVPNFIRDGNNLTTQYN